jgi:hypothetical protein
MVGRGGRNGDPERRRASTKMSSVTGPLFANRSRSLIHFARFVQRNCLSSKSHEVMILSHSKRRISEDPETAAQKPVRSIYASYVLSVLKLLARPRLLYLGPCAVWCDGEAKLSFCEDGLERGVEVFGRDICCVRSALDAVSPTSAHSLDSPNLATEASAWWLS